MINRAATLDVSYCLHLSAHMYFVASEDEEGTVSLNYPASSLIINSKPHEFEALLL
jgi:hypothetical protein